MGNAQQGTRGMSSGDLTRLKRLRGARGYQGLTVSNSDLAHSPANQVGHNPPILVSKVVGTSRIRRTGSQWTDWKGYNTADYVIQGQRVANSAGLTFGVSKICSCTTPSPYGVKKQGLCSFCSRKSLD